MVWFKDQSSQDRIIDLLLYAGDDAIKPVSVVCDLGVLLDQKLTMKQHISNVTSIAFIPHRRLEKVRFILGPEITASLVSAFVLNRLDYCNTVFASLAASIIAPLQRVQNAAARLVKVIVSPRDRKTSALRDLH